MTRETKIGLLVGLAFIIVIGILLSDHFRSTMEPPQAALASAASMVREAVTSPGTANPPIVIVAPNDAPPKQEVPTRDELNPTPSPVIPSVRIDPQNPRQTSTESQEDQTTTVTPPIPNDSLNNAAQQHGEELVQATPDGRPVDNDQSTPPPTVSLQNYVAQSGDSVSRLAAKYMGGNTRANRQAIIEANPSLQDDPDRVIVGETYVIPSKVAASTPADNSTTDAPAPTQTNTGSAAVYTVQPGDSLWRIANDELGDPDSIDAIKELNADVLRGKNHDVLFPGMRLRLPAKPVATAS
jgi:nucleoid-associated protein YgaU